jgi:hypothetical protein
MHWIFGNCKKFLANLVRILNVVAIGDWIEPEKRGHNCPGRPDSNSSHSSSYPAPRSNRAVAQHRHNVSPRSPDLVDLKRLRIPHSPSGSAIHNLGRLIASVPQQSQRAARCLLQEKSKPDRSASHFLGDCIFCVASLR